MAGSWRWLFPALFAAAWFATRKARKDWSMVGLAALASLVLYAGACSLGGGHYPALRQATALFALAFAVLVAATAGDSPRRGGLLLGALSLAMIAASATGVAAHDPAARWSSSHGTLSALFTRAIRESAQEPDGPVDRSLSHGPYFGTALQSRCRDRLLKEFGEPRGLLVISVDALRGDLPGRTIQDLPLTPELDKLAADGIVMTRAYSPAAISHWTLFSAFSGLLPGQITRHQAGLDGVPLVTDRLKRDGVVTRCAYPEIVHNARSRRQAFTRLDLGFEKPSIGTSPRRVQDVIDDIIPAAADKRWFSFLHIMTPHAPYDSAPVELITGGSDFDSYCGEVRLADRQVKNGARPVPRSRRPRQYLGRHHGRPR